VGLGRSVDNGEASEAEQFRHDRGGGDGIGSFRCGRGGGELMRWRHPGGDDGWSHRSGLLACAAASGDGRWRRRVRQQRAAMSGSCGGGAQRSCSSGSQKWNARREKLVGEGGRRKRDGRFLNLLIFVGCHIIDEHKRTMPCVLPPYVRQFAMSPMNRIRQC
jgi:hypothetical protein